MLSIIIALLASYLTGSIPTAYIFGRVMKGIDIRNFGSGNVGATNALRILGRGPGMLVLLLDVVKGVIPVVWFAALLPAGGALPKDAAHVLIGIACICGHVWTIFLNFKGGKGIATTLGVIIGLSLKFSGVGLVLVVLLCVWMLVFVFSRIVSLSSVISAVCFPIMMAFFQNSRIMTAASIFLSAFVIFKHRANLARLKQGREPRLKL